MEEENILKSKSNKKIWHPQQQIILKKWGEIGSSYRYLHDKAFMYYSKQNFRFALPVIVLSTITGTANFAQKSFPASTQDYVPLFIGFLNLTAGLITTVAQFLRVSELLEGHRSASLAYSKFSRNIAVELSLPVKQRTMDGSTFIKNCRQEIDRLIEQSPNIPQNILHEFGKKFADKDFVKPEILELRGVEIYIDNEDEEEQLALLASKKKDREREIIEQADLERKRIRKELQLENDKEKEMEKKIALSTLKQHKIEKKERITGGTVANSMSKLIERLNSSSNITSMSTLSETSDSSISNLSENSDNNYTDNNDNNGSNNNNNVELTINETSVSIPPPPEDDEVEENTTEAESIMDISDDESTQDLSGNNI
jgi:hypothetical protein